LLRNSDQSKYGTLLDTMTTTLSLGTNVFPKTKEKALDALSNHKLDQNYIDYKRDNEKPSRNDISKKLEMAETRIVSHKNPKTNLSAIVVERKATQHQIVLCGRKHHAKIGTSGESRLVHPVQIIMMRMKKSPQLDVERKDVIILDTGSTIGATFMSPKLLTDITTTGKPLEMVTNAGTKQMSKTGVIKGFGKAWFDPSQVANIFGFAKLEDQCQITYDSSVDSAFHTNNRIVKFTRNKDGLYVYRPPQNYFNEGADEEVDGEDSPERKVQGDENEESFLVDSVEENKICYTKREFESAKQARKLYHTLGCPTVENLKHIKNCPVTIGDASDRISGH
jgi:hypothetical protein